MKKYDVVGIGYPSLDYSIRLNDEPTLGETSIIQNDGALEPNYGGCAVNITYLLNTLGNKSSVSMIVGKDFAETGFKDFLEDKGVGLDFVQEDKELDTSYTQLVMSSDGEHMTLFYPGPMTTENYQPYDYSKLDARYGLLTIGELKGNIQFLESCIEKDIPLIFSMKGDYSSLDQDYVTKIFNHSELIFMNKSEYNQLNEYLPKKVLSYLERESLEAIIVTDGSRGSTIYTKDDKKVIPAYKETNVVDTAGGGDAYIAGFLNLYLDGEDLETCGAQGAVVSSYIIEDYGCLTNIPTEEQISKRKKILEEQ